MTAMFPVKKTLCEWEKSWINHVTWQFKSFYRMLLNDDILHDVGLCKNQLNPVTLYNLTQKCIFSLRSMIYSILNKLLGNRTITKWNIANLACFLRSVFILLQSGCLSCRVVGHSRVLIGWSISVPLTWNKRQIHLIGHGLLVRCLLPRCGGPPRDALRNKTTETANNSWEGRQRNLWISKSKIVLIFARREANDC